METKRPWMTHKASIMQDVSTSKPSAMSRRETLAAIAGRIAAISDLTPNPVSFSALERELGVSRSSISTNTRLLEYLGTIVRIKIKGQRENVFISFAQRQCLDNRTGA